MKQKFTLNDLEALSHKSLAQMLYEISMEDDHVHKRVEKLLLRENPTELYKVIRKEIVSIKRGRRFISYYESFAYAKKIHTIVEDIAVNVTDKKAIFALCGELIATDGKVYERCDDSAGAVQSAYHRAESLWRSALDGVDEEDIYRAYMDLRICDGFGTRDLLGEEVPEAVLMRIYDEVFSYASSKKYERYDYFSDMSTLKSCAHFLKRVDLYIRAVKLWDDPPKEIDWIDILKEYRYAENAQGAIEALEHIGKTDAYWADEVYEIKVWAYETLGKSVDVTLAYKEWYEQTLKPEILKCYLKRIEGTLRDMELERALKKAWRMSPHDAINFFKVLDEKALAASYIMDHKEDLKTEYLNSKTLKSLIAWLEADYPQAAVLLYRDSMRLILQRAQSKYYGWVIRALKAAKKIEDKNDTSAWSIPLHESFISDFLEKHRRKVRLMTLYNEAFEM